MKKLIVAGFVFSAFALQAQVNLTLDSCYEMARKNYPLIQQKTLIGEYGKQEQAKLQKNYFPTVTLNGQYKYQSDVISISPQGSPVPLNIEGLHNTYNATLDVQQLIWDGGTTRLQRKASDINTQLQQQNLESELYKIKDIVTQLYFNCILINKQLEILNTAGENLEANLEKVEALFENGASLKSNVQSIKAELMLTKQKIEDSRALKQTQLKMLGEYIGMSLPDSTRFNLPDNGTMDFNEIHRPEIEAFKLNRQYFEMNEKVLSSTRLPVVSAFGQAGYGKPGLNMLSDQFNSYYIAGISLRWNLWDWNKTRNDKAMLNVNSDMVQTRRETFEKNIRISAVKQQEEIDKLNHLIAIDEDIIRLRTEVKDATASQLQNGVITSSEYITELNNEVQARLNMELHKIQLELAKVNLLNLYGQL